MKKLFSSVILATVMMVSSVANAGLIVDEDSGLTGSIGGLDWVDTSVSEIFVFDPFQFIDGYGFLRTNVMNGDISNIALGSTGQPIKTDGGSYQWNTFYRFGSPDSDGLISGLSIVFDYVTESFTNETYLASLIGTITLDLQTIDITGSIFGANNPGANNSAWTIDFNYFAPDNNPGIPGIKVPEPSSIAILALGMIGLVSRKKLV